MSIVKVIADYKAFIVAVGKVAPAVLTTPEVKTFLSAEYPTANMLRTVSKLIQSDMRTVCENAGFDVDLLPTVPNQVVSLSWLAGDMATLSPAKVIIESESSDPALQNVAETLPTIVTLTKYKKWSVHATSHILPYLRKFISGLEVSYMDDTLTRLKELASAPVVPAGKVCFGPKRTIDVELYIVFPAFAEALKKRFDGRLVGDNTFRIPAARLREIIDFCLAEGDLPLIFSEELQKVADTAKSSLSWNGDLRSLTAFKIESLATITNAIRNALTKNNYLDAYSLLLLAPRKYIDRSNPTRIVQLKDGDEVALVATVRSVKVDPRRKMVVYQVSDGTGSIGVSFFNAIWMSKKFKAGDSVLLFGKVASWGKSGPKRLGLTNPMMEHFTDQNLPIIPIYPQTSSISTEDIRKSVFEFLDRLTVDASESFHSERHSGSEILDALRYLHMPKAMTEVAQGRELLAYEELFRLQLILAVEKYAAEHQTGLSNGLDQKIFDKILTALPYGLTSAQKKAWVEINLDLASKMPMHRLLQGDVGSGKTTLAVLSLIAAVVSGRQAALLAPTEILASQLFDNVKDLLESLSDQSLHTTRVQLYTNKLRGKAKDTAYQELADGTVHIAVGTHALLTEGVSFHDLGVVVVDEQHRFGVEQRARLSQARTDGKRPDMLVMTATPIPRTAALTIFGALDVSILDELPPGRTPIETVWVDSEISLESSQAKAWQLMASEVKKGRQGYVVCPLVEESDKLQVASATETFEALSNGALKGVRLGLVHGQMKHDEKSAVMRQFRDGSIDVLVSTTVIEVGVNVPNATVMIILDPQRFGMAQLHQLRGRVGRGAFSSTCLLYGRAVSESSRARLSALVESTDGFKLSEIDLQLRGPGQMFGVSQSGISDLNIADVVEDIDLLLDARDSARTYLSNADPKSVASHLTDSLTLEAKEWLFKS